MTTRTLHLIDLENLAAGATDHQLAHTGLAAHLNAYFTTGDIVVVASCRALFRRTGFALQGLPHRFRIVESGPDAADHELIRAAGEVDGTAFTHLAIASGDGIFTDLAVDAASQGIFVSVSSRPKSLARRLKLAAHETLELPALSIPSPQFPAQAS